MITTPSAVSRRSFILTSAGLAASTILSPAADAPPTGPFKLGPLPYDFGALDPYVDAKTMEIHHDKHHAAYVAKLNEAVVGLTGIPEDPKVLISDLSKLPDKVQMAARNHGGGHFNHTLFWSLMGKVGAAGVGGEPSGKIGPAITKAFGSFKEFQTKFADAGMKRFGSGWAWLIAKPDGSLAITSTANQDSPLMKGIVPEAEQGAPLLGIDVWEHAYYLKYQNKRADYITAWWNVVNWSHVDELLAAAK
jgi:Fe-Mn family superoxide dismutase